MRSVDPPHPPGCLDDAQLLAQAQDVGAEASAAHLKSCVRCQERLARVRAQLDPKGLDDLLNAVNELDCETRAVPNSADSLEHEKALPQQIGRYQIRKLLGRGGFGTVYLAEDQQLQRLVAIKIPHPARLTLPEVAATYLTEARTVASLDHPNIVPVFDVGATDECPCFIVSKYIEGAPLSERITTDRPSEDRAAELVARVAEALHYAHRNKLVHRDIKPGNILIDATGNPLIVDFGLALKDENVGKGVRFAGSPAYMSPEQARGEGHRVDARSDIFSLGVVFYELLTGSRPFKGESQADVLEQVQSFEPRPPRQHDDTLPKELERICMKCLSKRASERYSTAMDLAEDLRHWIGAQNNATARIGVTDTALRQVAIQQVEPAKIEVREAAYGASSSRGSPLYIVPKGLRSFDSHDADFFLELLPGPRDREGLPDSIRFWKNRIEESDADQTFAVGLIYGPSGCGKSSLVKAGLIPRLSDNVITIYVEATGEETEPRVLNGLRKRCPALASNLTLKETLAELRLGRAMRSGEKVLIVLDQFEQWLHAKKDEHDTELVQALRQCDGGRLQCIVMVRDDFWLAVSRFLRELEIRLVEGENSALADLFDLNHARKVLAAFGRAFGRLPEYSSETDKNAKQFLDQAVAGLAQEGKVVCVRLALFSEMMKGKPWTPDSLKEVGGTDGVGVTFLEETFSATTAPPDHRYHQKAAREVLKCLLPESGSDIKGHMRSLAELRKASGYADRPQDFDELIRILDAEVRLLTPTDPQGKESSDTGAAHVQSGHKYYQLTHDYLVPALREWLTRKQKETRRGRAELLLADRAGVWIARQENSQLPSLPQWLGIRALTQRNTWTQVQRQMMARGARYHAFRAGALVLIMTIAVAAGLTIRRQIADKEDAASAAGLVSQLTETDIKKAPALIDKIAPLRKWADPLLREENKRATPASRAKLNTSLALLPVDADQAQFLYSRMLRADPDELMVVRSQLSNHKSAFVDKLWSVVETPEHNDPAMRVRAAAALATYDPGNSKWAAWNQEITKALLAESRDFAREWAEVFRPVKDRLIAPLRIVFESSVPDSAHQRELATSLLADYATDNPKLLAELLMRARHEQFILLYPKFEATGELGLKFLVPAAKEDDLEALADQRANAAVALVRMKHPATVWPLLAFSSDPRCRSYLIDRLGKFGADPKVVIQQLRQGGEASIRRALILSLGEFRLDVLPPDDLMLLTKSVRELYLKDPDPGIHAAAEWLLRHWDRAALRMPGDHPAGEEPIRTLKDIAPELSGKGFDRFPKWYINVQRQTMVVIPGPVQSAMGSPPMEHLRMTDEEQRKALVPWSFSISAKPITAVEFRTFDNTYNPIYRGGEPAVAIQWYQAAAYCNWLSEREGIPEPQWCYQSVQVPFGDGTALKLKTDWQQLEGYRLPTEAELEYAIRAGTSTSYSFGETADLLDEYAWWVRNSELQRHPAGEKKPNDLGIFDAHGNVWTWCQDQYDSTTYVLRGGSWMTQAASLRSAKRSNAPPTNSSGDIGFRLARTLTPDALKR